MQKYQGKIINCQLPLPQRNPWLEPPSLGSSLQKVASLLSEKTKTLEPAALSSCPPGHLKETRGGVIPRNTGLKKQTHLVL